ncbi:MAG TPA: ribonuclease HII [Roseiarcus sp.]|nr:ribonuclease HII [Roseiarcus sp.]
MPAPEPRRRPPTGSPDFVVERACIRNGAWPVAGVDEAGRGPLAGPVAVAAVVLDPKKLPAGVDDSKALTARQREPLFDLILARALCVSLAFACAEEIDAHNIRVATLRAMARAVGALALRPKIALIDGRDVPAELGCSARAIIGGDAACLSIAAASIVAKVARDRLMARLDAHCPGYGFASHVGYSTRAHIDALAALGPSPFHRRSFKPAAIEAPELPGLGLELKILTK